jgi:hypothetical protein
MRLLTLGVGAQRSPCYAPAGLLVSHRGQRVMIDGGPGAAPEQRLDAWLVCDDRSELQPRLRTLAARQGLVPAVAPFETDHFRVTPHRVVHTNHPTHGYLIETERARVVWAPEFFRFPAWAAGAQLMFAEAAAFDRPIRFVGGVGGHLPVLAVAAAARRARIERLVFAHIGRPTLRAIDAGLHPPFGEFARDGQVFFVRD